MGLGALSKGSARRTVGKAGPPSRIHASNMYTLSPPVNSLCVCVCVCMFAGEGDKRESKIWHGHVYFKLLFPLQVPVP